MLKMGEMGQVSESGVHFYLLLVCIGAILWVCCLEPYDGIIDSQNIHSYSDSWVISILFISN